MKISVFLAFLLFTCTTATSLKCWVSFGLSCKILNQDLIGVSEVTYDIGELEFEDFKSVSFIETKLSDVPVGTFSVFIEATEFVLSENDLKEWKPEYLKGADKLTALYIYKNSIENLAAKSFSEATNLEMIEIIQCKIATIAPNSFSGLNNLNELRLQENKIGLDLRSNTFSELSHSLKKLNIADNKIEKIPQNFFKNLEKLEELTIYYNEQIKEIDGEIFPESLKKIVGRKFDLEFYGGRSQNVSLNQL